MQIKCMFEKAMQENAGNLRAVICAQFQSECEGRLKHLYAYLFPIDATNLSRL